MSIERALEVRLDGENEPIGHLRADEYLSTSFVYAPTYLAKAAIPLSLSLPLQDEPFDDVVTKAFFDNLLPENDQLAQVMDRERLPRGDIVGLLYHVGADCSGAVSCLPLGAPPVKMPGDLAQDYDAIPDDELAKIVRSLATKKRLPDKVKDPSPVAGVQRKLALTQLPDGRLAFPKSGSRVPTTHILKVPEIAEGRDARLEAAAARLAEAAGLDVSVPDAITVDGVEALLIKRFDRHEQDGHVFRIHQEDFAQALGLPAALKYERKGVPGRRFDVAAILSVLDRIGSPGAAKRAFLAATVFNLAIGNTDNHAKNHALLYDVGRVPRLAPLYDLTPIRLNKDLLHDLSFNIGNASHPDAVTGDDLTTFFGEFGLKGSPLKRFIQGEMKEMLERVEAATSTLGGQMLKDFDDMIGAELDRVVQVLDIDLELRERDYFAVQGGGWGSVS